MPSVGSILLTVQAKTDDLEKNLSRAQQKIRDLEGTAKKAGAGMAESLSKSTINAAKFAGGLALLSSTFKQFSGESDTTATKVLDGLSKMAAGYAVGGPLGAGVVGITQLLGYLTEQQQLAAEAAKKWADEVARANATITKGLLEDFDSVTKRLDGLRDAGKSGAQRAMEELERAQRDLARIEGTEDAAGRRLGSIASTDEIDSDSKAQADNLRLLYNQMLALRSLLPMLEGNVRREAVSLTLADLRAEAGVLGQIGALESDLAGERSNVATITRAIADLERERAIISRDTTAEGQAQAADLDRQIRLQRQLLTATRSFNAEQANRDIRSQIDSIMGRGNDYSRQIEQWTRDGASAGLIAAFQEVVAAKPMREFVASLTDDLRSSVADALFDGIVNGGRNGADILNNLLNSLLKKTLDSIVGSVFGMLGGGGGGFLAGLFGGGGGGGIASIATSLVGGIAGGGGGGSILPLPDT